MNKNILKYIPMLMALIMVSCSSDDTLEGINPSAEVLLESDNEKYEVVATKSGYEAYQSNDSKPLTRSALQYNRKTNLISFSWTSGDKIGIFYIGDDKDVDEEDKVNQFAFVLDENEPINKTATSATGVFVGVDEAARFALRPNTRYISYIPFMEQDQQKGNFTYEGVPVSFRNQQQKANVKMGCYFLMQTSDDEYGVKYHQSEAEACAHLADYNYQVSDVISTPAANAHFVYSALPSVVRFYMYAPDPIIYDCLQVVNNKADFVLDAKMNVKEKTLTPVKTGHVLSLSFNDDEGENSFDMTNNTNYDYWRQSSGKGFVMAYMMIAPINLKELDINSTLYLCGHDSSNKKHYYRASLSKLNFEAGKHHQWSVALTDKDVDEPITFEEVTVQTWTSAVYGNNGAGTETW